MRRNTWQKSSIFIFTSIFLSIISFSQSPEDDLIFEDSVADAFFHRFQEYKITHSLEDIKEKMDSIIIYCEEKENHWCLAHFHGGLGVFYRMEGDLTKSKFHAKKALSSAESTDNFYEISGQHLALGLIDQQQGKFDSTQYHFTIAKSLLPKIDRIGYHAFLNNRLGLFFHDQGKHDSAYHFFNKSIDSNLALKDSTNASINYGNIANVMVSYYNYDRAHKYINTAFEYSNKEKNPIRYGITKSVQSKILSRLGKDSLAKASALEALDIFISKNRKNHISNVSSLLSSIYLKEGNISKAKDILANIQDTDKMDDLELKFTYLLAFFRYNVTTKDLSKSKEFYEKLKSNIGNIDHVYNKIEFYKLASKHLEQVGNNLGVLESKLEYHQLKDTLENFERNNAIENLEIAFETSQKEDEIVRLSLQDEIKNSRIKTQRLALGASVGILALLSFLSFRLFGQNKKIERQNTEKEILLKEIHHRVKNNLQVISSLLGIQSRSISDEKAKEAIQEGRTRVHSMALIHQDLYRTTNLSGIDMPSYLKKLSRNLIDTYQVDNINIELVTEIEAIKLDVETVIPIGLIVNELITNSLKHAFPNRQNGTISIFLKTNKDQLCLMVKDDGIGLTNEQVSDQSESFGHSLIKAFKTKLDAEVQIEGIEGTTATVNIRNYKLIS